MVTISYISCMCTLYGEQSKEKTLQVRCKNLSIGKYRQMQGRKQLVTMMNPTLLLYEGVLWSSTVGVLGRSCIQSSHQNQI